MDHNRRDFLRITGMLGAGLYGPLNIREADPYNVWKPLPPERLERSEAVCPFCQSRCGLELFRKKDMVFGIYPKDQSRGLCARGISYHNIIYGEGRIKTPLLRSGERGNLNFKAIDYGQAFEILAGRLKAGGFFTDALAAGEAEKFYLNALSEKSNFHGESAVRAVFGADMVYFDFENADIVLNFGADILEEGGFQERAGIVARKARNIITFSPMVPAGTFQGEQWYPVPSGSCGAVMDAVRAAVRGVPLPGDTEKRTGLKAEDFAEIAMQIRGSRRVCVSFPTAAMETVEGMATAVAAVGFAKELKMINREGGVFFYKGMNSSKPFDIMGEVPAAYLAYNIDPLLLYPTPELTAQLAKLPFIVYMGHHHSDISAMADLILPSPFFVEREDAYFRKDSGSARLVTSAIAVPGGVEAIDLRDRDNIEVLFQKVLNYRAPYGIKDVDEIARVLNPRLPVKKTYIDGLGKTMKITITEPSIPKEEIPVAAGEGIALHLYRDAILGIENRGSKWAEELGRDNPLLMNSRTAHSLGFKKGDRVTVKANGGSVKARIFVYEGIADGTVGLKRFRKKVAGNVYATAGKGLSKDREAKLVWWEDGDRELEKLLRYKPAGRGVFTFSANTIEIAKR